MANWFPTLETVIFSDIMNYLMIDDFFFFVLLHENQKYILGSTAVRAFVFLSLYVWQSWACLHALTGSLPL